MSIPLLLMLLAEAESQPRVVDRIAASGRVAEQGVSESERVNPPKQIAPGRPPLLQFRYLEGSMRHRFGDSGLVLDDAGH